MTQNQQRNETGRGSALTMAAKMLVVAIIGVASIFGVAQDAHSESSLSRAAATPSATNIAQGQSAILGSAPHFVGTQEDLPAQSEPNPDSVVRAYFDAINSGINSGDFVAAWALGGKNVAGVGYSSFVDGFSATADDTVTINSVSGHTVGVQLDATQTDGSHRFFSGTYTVQDGVIIAANIHQD